MWWNNSVFVGIVALATIACWTLERVPLQAKDIVIPIITGIAGIVTGIAAKIVKDGITTLSQTTKEETTNDPEKK